MAGVAAMLVGAVPALGQDVDGWPTVQGGPTHSGSVSEPGLRPPLERVWRVAASGEDGGLSGAIVWDGLAVACGRTEVVGFDAESGEVLWTIEREEAPLDPAAIDPDTGDAGILVYTETDDDGGALVAVDLDDRAELWRATFDAAARGSPAIAEEAAFVGTHDGVVHAIDMATGDERWSFQADGRVDSAPAVSDELVFVVAEDFRTGAARLHALDVDTGDERWHVSRPPISLRASSPSVAEGVVYAGFGDGSVRAFDVDGGGEQWRRPTRGFFSPLSMPALFEGDVYVADRSGSVYRLDGETGDPEWDHQFPSEALRGSPLVVGDAVYIGMEDGLLAAIESATGDLVWRSALPGPAGPIAPAGELLLASTAGPRGGIVAFRRDPDGRTIRVASPTVLDLPRALLNFAIAFAAVLVGLLGFFGWVGRGVAARMAAAEDRTARK